MRFQKPTLSGSLLNRMSWAPVITILFSIICSVPASAQYKHERLRRITVFPVKVDVEIDRVAEEAWWDMRERLSSSKKFLIASKNFMQAKDVFQPRGELSPADVVVLGRLLDADALISTFVVGRRASLRAFETKNGLTLWKGDIDLHPALPVSQQLPDAVKKLSQDFISSIPYQGAVIVDSLIGRPSYQDGERLFFKADVGAGTQISVGDTVQLIRVTADKLLPVFQQGSTIEVYVEGQVTKVDRQIITVQVTRRQDNADVVADALVRVPDELRRMREMYGMSESSDKNLGVEALVYETQPLTTKQKETKPLVTALSWISNLVVVFLVAF